ncbi:hypothetical protein HN873_043521, partial [Arachis hypogaea]
MKRRHFDFVKKKKQTKPSPTSHELTPYPTKHPLIQKTNTASPSSFPNQKSSFLDGTATAVRLCRRLRRLLLLLSQSHTARPSLIAQHVVHSQVKSLLEASSWCAVVSPSPGCCVFVVSPLSSCC